MAHLVILSPTPLSTQIKVISLYSGVDGVISSTKCPSYTLAKYCQPVLSSYTSRLPEGTNSTALLFSGTNSLDVLGRDMASILTWVSLLQPSKACLPISLRLEGSHTFFRPLQFWKALVPIVSTPDGRWSSSSLDMPLKALAPIVDSFDFEENVTVWRPLRPWKALSPILVMASEKTNFSIFDLSSLSLNTFSPTAVTVYSPLSIVIFSGIDIVLSSGTGALTFIRVAVP